MPPLIGYGEDALTLWALTERLRDLLDKLGDDSPLDEVVRFYRPSFGRGTGSFGERDAILATPKAVYPIESKWHQSGEHQVGRGTICLSDCQMRRHQLFDWYFKKWREGRPWKDWAAFLSAHREAFRADFTDDAIVDPKSSKWLLPNLKYLLDHLAERASTVQHVVLYFTLEGLPSPGQVVWGRPSQVASNFRLVTLRYAPIAGSNHFEMACPLGSPTR